MLMIVRSESKVGVAKTNIWASYYGVYSWGDTPLLSMLMLMIVKQLKSEAG